MVKNLKAMNEQLLPDGTTVARSKEDGLKFIFTDTVSKTERTIKYSRAVKYLYDMIVEDGLESVLDRYDVELKEQRKAAKVEAREAKKAASKKAKKAARVKRTAKPRKRSNRKAIEELRVQRDELVQTQLVPMGVDKTSEAYQTARTKVVELAYEMYKLGAPTSQNYLTEFEKLGYEVTNEEEVATA